MPNPAAVIVPILFLAFLCEGLVEYLAKPLLRPRKLLQNQSDDTTDYHPLVLRYVAAIIGIILAIAYRADILAMIGLSEGWPYLGYIITGIVIGRGSNYMNDLADRWLTQRN